MGHTTSHAYDALNRETVTTDARTGMTAYTYDAADNRLTLADSVSNKTTFVYDTLNRLHQINYNVGTTGVPATPTVTFNYGTSAAQNNNGRLRILPAG